MPEKRATDILTGSIHQFERPAWEPLLEIAGDLCVWFMWMGEIRLSDGTAVHAYKHRDTRRYFHLAADGRAFRYVPPVDVLVGEGMYRELDRTEAIHEAFHTWRLFHEGDEEFASVLAELDAVTALARRGEQATYDPVWLERQRRFERAVDDAQHHEQSHDPGFHEVRFDDGNRFIGDIASGEDDGVAQAA